MAKKTLQGEIDPDVLKLFLNSAIMNTRSDSEYLLYEHLMETKEQVGEADPKEIEEYKDQLTIFTLKTHMNSDMYMSFQMGREFLPAHKWLNKQKQGGCLSPQAPDL